MERVELDGGGEVTTLKDPLGTPHPVARCGWCDGPLVVGQVADRRCWLCPTDYPRQVACALLVTPKGGTQSCVDVPLPSQVRLDETAARYVLSGGRAGPGKSHGGRHWLYRRCLTVPSTEALLLRENYPQLDKTHLRRMEREVPVLGGRFFKNDRKAVFGTGSKESIIDCGHMDTAEAVGQYASTEYAAIVADEASLYPLDGDGVTPLAELSTRARLELPDREGRPVEGRFLAVTNPGGPSALWLREMFIERQPDFDKYPKLREDYNPEQWVYFPGNDRDNPYLPPTFHASLSVLSGTRYQQLAEGDWYAFAGQFFSEWRPEQDGRPWHVRRWAA